MQAKLLWIRIPSVELTGSKALLWACKGNDVLGLQGVLWFDWRGNCHDKLWKFSRVLT